MSHPFAAAAAFAALSAVALAAVGCSQESAAAVYPTADLRPPDLIAAGPSDSRSVRVRFDEAVTPVQGSLSVEPRADLSCRAEDRDLVVSFASDQAPGADYALAGEVEDLRGNRSRFLIRFVGWNDRAPPLRLSEVQTGKNSSKTNPHRDYLEFEVLADGNVGGEEVSWTSSVKTSTYRFPGIECRKGDFIVLHLAPEGLDAERDELGGDLSVSGGVDASAIGRDLWCSISPLPDESGAVALSLRPGSEPIDGFFYADDAKSGGLSDDKLAEMLSTLSAARAWPLAGAKPAWEDGFRWNGSPAKSLCRSGTAHGPSAWYVTATGGQSPGSINAAPDSGAVVKSAPKSGAKATAKKSTKKIGVKRP
jgi:hypothetical protein